MPAPIRKLPALGEMTNDEIPNAKNRPHRSGTKQEVRPSMGNTGEKSGLAPSLFGFGYFGIRPYPQYSGLC